MAHEQLVYGPTNSVVSVIHHTVTFPEPFDEQRRQKRRWWMPDRSFLLKCGLVKFVLTGLVLSGLMFWYMIFTGQIG